MNAAAVGVAAGVLSIMATIVVFMKIVARVVGMWCFPRNLGVWTGELEPLPAENFIW